MRLGGRQSDLSNTTETGTIDDGARQSRAERSAPTPASPAADQYPLTPRQQVARALTNAVVLALDGGDVVGAKAAAGALAKFVAALMPEAESTHVENIGWLRRKR
jgi:hypothetical protein